MLITQHRPFTHIIPLGVQSKRSRFLLKRYGVQRFHFLDPDIVDLEYRKQGLQCRDEILSEWSGVSEENIHRHTVCCYDFEKSFLHLFEILEKEKALGNTVVQHIFSGSRIVAISLAFASCLSEQDIFYVRAGRYTFDGKSVIDDGVDEKSLKTFTYLPLVYPIDRVCTLLETLFLREEKCTSPTLIAPWKITRDDLAEELKPKEGFHHLSDSARKTIVSNTLKDMVKLHFIAADQRNPGRPPGTSRSYALSLTEYGRFWAKIVSIRREAKRGNNLQICLACPPEKEQ